MCVLVRFGFGFVGFEKNSSSVESRLMYRHFHFKALLRNGIFNGNKCEFQLSATNKAKMKCHSVNGELNLILVSFS